MVARGTLPGQRTVAGSLADIAERVAAAGIRPPAITLVGPAAALRETLAWLERRPLHGQVVAVTRARAQASELAARLAALGAEVIEAPAIRIEPRGRWSCPGSTDFDLDLLHEPQRRAAVLRAPRRRRALARRRARWRRSGRARPPSLRAHGIRADVVPERFVAEALLEALRRAVEGRRVLVARAAEARDVLPDALRERGAEVDVRGALRHRAPSRSTAEALTPRHPRDLHLQLHRALLPRRRRAAGRGARGLDRPGDQRRRCASAASSRTWRPSATTSTGWSPRWWRMWRGDRHPAHRLRPRRRLRGRLPRGDPAHLPRGADRGHHPRPAPLRRAPGRARAAQHAALHAAWGCTWRWWTRRWAPSAAPLALRTRRRPHPGRPRQRRAVAWPGSAAAASSWPWTSRRSPHRLEPVSATFHGRDMFAPGGRPPGRAARSWPTPATRSTRPSWRWSSCPSRAARATRWWRTRWWSTASATSGSTSTTTTPRAPASRSAARVEIEAGGRALPGHLRPDLRRRAARRADRLRGRLPHARRGDQPRRRRGHARPAARRRGAAAAAMIGRPRVHHRRTDSTNERARELARQGAPHGTLVTRGRADARAAGARAEPGAAPPGSAVLMSLVLRELSRDAAARRRGGGVRGAAAARRDQVAQRRAGSKAARWRASSWRAGRRRAGRCWASG